MLRKIKLHPASCAAERREGALPDRPRSAAAADSLLSRAALHKLVKHAMVWGLSHQKHLG